MIVTGKVQRRFWSFRLSTPDLYLKSELSQKQLLRSNIQGYVIANSLVAGTCLFSFTFEQRFPFIHHPSTNAKVQFNRTHNVSTTCTYNLTCDCFFKLRADQTRYRSASRSRAKVSYSGDTQIFVGSDITIVQGVNFRSFTVKQAKSLGITGHVQNASDGSVCQAQSSQVLQEH